jgi:Arc/MetJ-type ribon-helix-helix transcriptional regulator
MAYTFPSDLQQSIQALLATGKYDSEDAVLRSAVAALRQREEDIAAIRAGIADMEAGRYRPLAEVDAEFRQKHGLANRQ